MHPMKKQVIPSKNKTVLVGWPIFVVKPIPIINQPEISNIIDDNIFNVLLISQMCGNLFI